MNEFVNDAENASNLSTLNENFGIFDIEKMRTELASEGIYSEEKDNNNNFYIRQEEEEDSISYFCNYNINNTIYYGGFDLENFHSQENAYCKYSSGDIYVGTFYQNQRQELGLYFFNEQNTNNPNDKKKTPKTKYKQIYLGKWDKDQMEGEGIFIWVPKESKQIEKSEMKIFEGEIKNGKLCKGLYLTMKNDKFWVMWGNPNQEQNDENSYFYATSAYGEFVEKIYVGKIKEGIFVEGNIVSFQGECDFVGYESFTWDAQKKKQILVKNKTNETEEKIKEKEEIIRKAGNFRNQCLEDDYFGIIFDVYKENLIKKKEDFERCLNDMVHDNVMFSLELDEKIQNIVPDLNDIYSKLNFYKNFQTAYRHKKF